MQDSEQTLKEIQEVRGDNRNEIEVIEVTQIHKFKCTQSIEVRKDRKDVDVLNKPSHSAMHSRMVHTPHTMSSQTTDTSHKRALNDFS
jgi:hypothetical protein